MREMNEVQTKIITYEGDEWNTNEDNNLWGRWMKYKRR